MPTLTLDTLRRDVPEFPDAVHTKADDFGEGEFYAHVQGYDDDIDMLVVRLELPEDAPAAQDAIADGHSYEQAEFIALVPREGAVSAALHNPGDPIEDPRPWLQQGKERRADEAEQAEHDARIARIQDEMRSGKRTRPFPELRA